ncbi:hypothetical protein IW261DRAFT_1665450 [Armillaria novae-zelandiae]|uniref:Uncharacterized protein n=1 Tax=Armillaria novae-zelandiae TaxID=153914 RepID=A0AA39NW80_9AGAR|nr:hypothetical protein IW261DRAFT_1572559 [Armillaria novae-zelandiae]KAK0472553.1 hypothetical protein IW261DRAFT_1665450 [Armillaria novae-zelandiae]
MRLHWPHTCVQKLSFTVIDINLKPHARLEWCTPAREFEMRSISNPTLYAPLLSGLSELKVIKLDRITFQRLEHLFELLQSLSTKVEDLMIGEDVKFVSMLEDDPVLWTGKRIKIESLRVSATLVLELLLRDDSRVDLSYLKVVETRHAGSRAINKFVRLSPRLVNLNIEDPLLESNNEPSEAELEELTIRLPSDFVMEGRGEWGWLAFALSRRLKLKRVKVVAWTTWPYKKRCYAELMLNDLRRKLEPQRRRISGILANVTRLRWMLPTGFEGTSRFFSTIDMFIVGASENFRGLHYCSQVPGKRKCKRRRNGKELYYPSNANFNGEEAVLVSTMQMTN